MKKTVLRVYSSEDEYTNTGECYFLVMPDSLDEWEWEEELERRLAQISGMRWQNYDRYLLGTAEIEEKELFWAEIARYELYECKININRVGEIKHYKVPEWLR